MPLPAAAAWAGGFPAHGDGVPSTELENSMRKSCLLVLLWFSLLQGALADTDPDCKKMIVAGNDEYQPISWRDKVNPGKIDAIAVELIEMAMKDQGVAVESVYVGNWKRAQLSVRNGEADLLHSAYMTEERKTYMEYVTPPFLIDKTAILVRKNDPLTHKKHLEWSDLVGLSGAAPLGNSYGDKFDKYAKDNLKIDWTTSTEVAFKKLLAGRSQYVIYGLYPALAVAEAEGIRDQIEPLQTAIISEGMYITISKKSPCLKYKDHLSKKIKEYVDQGVTDKLLEKYIGLWKEQAKMKKP